MGWARMRSGSVCDGGSRSRRTRPAGRILPTQVRRSICSSPNQSDVCLNAGLERGFRDDRPLTRDVASWRWSSLGDEEPDHDTVQSRTTSQCENSLAMLLVYRTENSEQLPLWEKLLSFRPLLPFNPVRLYSSCSRCTVSNRCTILDREGRRRFPTC